MAKAFFNVLFRIIKSIVNVFLAPVNLLFVSFFPDFSNMISTFNSIVTRYVGGVLSFFAYLIPPLTKSFIILYLGVLISYYTIAISVHLILKVIEIIKKVKVW